MLPFGRSGERREEQISRGANGIIKTEGGGKEGEEGRKEALVSNRKRHRVAVAADWPNSQLNLQALRTARSQGVASVTSFKLQTLKVLGIALSQSN